MSIDKDSTAFALAISIIMVLIGSVSAYRVRIMKGVKKNIDDLFSMFHTQEKEIGDLKTENEVLKTLIDERTGKKK